MLYLVFALLPLYWILSTSLKEPTEIYSFPLKYLPKMVSFTSYRNLFKFTNFWNYFSNSLIVASVASFFALAITVFSGYSISRYSFKFKKYVLFGLFFTMMIPMFLIIIPLYETFSKIGMIDRLITLIILYMNMMMPFSAVMAKSFIDSIPVNLEEAAMVDGCSRIQALFKIVLPLSVPGLIAIFSFSFINTWNELFLAVMFINSNTKMTVPVALNSFISKAGIGWDILSADLVVSLLPTIIIFIFTQHFIMSGITKEASFNN